MSTPRPADSPQITPGWRADDLTLRDVDPLIDGFIAKFVPGTPDQCWAWAGRRVANGRYGSMRHLGRDYYAHRIAWVAFTGRSLTGNITIDHLCRNKLCVNPGHLEPVTLNENISRERRSRGRAV